MDAKKILAMVLEQRFWIICGVITVLPVGGWFTTTSAMRKETEDRKGVIKSKFSDADSIKNKPDPPNDTSHAGMDKLIEELKRRVGVAWQMQYDQQKAILVWPQELGDDFLKAVRPLNPPEKVKFPTPPQDELAIKLRERYRDYIKAELPKLATIIGASWQVNESAAMGMDGDMGGLSPGGFGGMIPGMAGMGGMTPGSGEGTSIDPNTGMPIGDTSIVNWNSADQGALMARYDWSNKQFRVPKTLDVLYAQEDLWIMTALMHIIADTNQGATARYNSVVKEIQYINVGAQAGRTSGAVMVVGSSQGGGMGMGDGMGMDMGMGGADMGMGGADMGMGGMGEGSLGMAPTGDMGMAGEGDMGMGLDSGGEGMGMGMGMGAGMASIDPANFRYVDFNYQPIPSATLRSAIESDAQNEAEAYLLVAKRVPIRLGLTVDQRKLNRLIAACGNSKLMVEVRQVRFNRQGGSAAGGMGGMGMGGMGGMMMGGLMSGGSGGEGMPGGRGMMPDGGGFGGGGFGGGGFGGMGLDGGSGGEGMMGGIDSGSTEASVHNKPIEVFGVVYIYNPVDVKKLRLEDKPSDNAAEGGDASTPTEPAADAAATGAGG